MSRPTRRGFFKRTGAAVAGFVVGTFVRGKRAEAQSGKTGVFNEFSDSSNRRGLLGFGRKTIIVDSKVTKDLLRKQLEQGNVKDPIFWTNFFHEKQKYKIELQNEIPEKDRASEATKKIASESHSMVAFANAIEAISIKHEVSRDYVLNLITTIRKSRKGQQFLPNAKNNYDTLSFELVKIRGKIDSAKKDSVKEKLNIEYERTAKLRAIVASLSEAAARSPGSSRFDRGKI
ncbi:MAG TPA: hypothetical protein VFF13_03900 [archaeon]|nr:hypothetical protein [archaeon]